jgi:hypothetical protein
MVLFGDPLYNPWRGKNFATGEHLALQPIPGSAPGALPVAPSERPFPDPLQTMAQWHQRRQALLAQVDTLMHELTRHEQVQDTEGSTPPQEDKGPQAESKTRKGKGPARSR